MSAQSGMNPSAVFILIRTTQTHVKDEAENKKEPNGPVKLSGLDKVRTGGVLCSTDSMYM